MPLNELHSMLSPSVTQHRTTKDLASAKRHMIQIMSECQFGRIENLPFRGGEPLLNEGVKVVRVARLGGESGGTNVPAADEFELKQAVRDLFDELARLRDGLIVRLEFRRGLPCLLETIVAAVPGELPSAPEAKKGS